MLEHAIKATTFPGDIVLDCFAGSGSTALAALNLGRRSISIEIDPLWVRKIAERLQLYAISAVRGKSRHRTVSLDRSMSYGLFCPGTI